MATIRSGLLTEITLMSFDTLRANKMRSALTVLGVVIGITSLVGMTSLIRGFNDSLADSMRQTGANTIYVQKFGLLSFASGKSFVEVLKRPNLTIEDARAIAREAKSIALVDIWLGTMGGNSRARLYYKSQRTKQLSVLGATENFAAVNFTKLEMGRFFVNGEVEHRRQVVVGYTAYESLFSNVDPIGKKVRIGRNEFSVIGVMSKRPSTGFDSGEDDLVVIPYTTHEKFYGRVGGGTVRVNGAVVNESSFRSGMLALVVRPDVAREQAMLEVQTILRIRHNLRLEQPDDFDLVTGDAIMKAFDQLTQAGVLALVVISSIALMVGGIGVMAIMMISVTERTREIGVRKALGARRREILIQFLIEAAFLTSAGGVLGILLGSAVGLGIHWATGFPVSLPASSFALGIGFSAAVGIFFGLFPAIKASRLDPIEALRYE
jgi:putative ABC transport system permease protein